MRQLRPLPAEADLVPVFLLLFATLPDFWYRLTVLLQLLQDKTKRFIEHSRLNLRLGVLGLLASRQEQRQNLFVRRVCNFIWRQLLKFHGLHAQAELFRCLRARLLLDGAVCRDRLRLLG